MQVYSDNAATTSKCGKNKDICYMLQTSCNWFFYLLMMSSVLSEYTCTDKKKICQFFYITFHLTSAQSFASVYTLITILSRPIKMQGLCCPLYDIIDMQGSSPLTRSRLVMRLWKKLIPASETVTLAQNLLKHVMTSTQGFLTVLGRLFHSNLNRSRYMYPVDN